jgi:hypothetical protein
VARGHPCRRCFCDLERDGSVQRLATLVLYPQPSGGGPDCRRSRGSHVRPLGRGPHQNRGTELIARQPTGVLAGAGRWANRVGLARLAADVGVTPQSQRHWCWAACAEAISRFYAETSSWTQCTIADAVLGKGDCCQGSRDCDRPRCVYEALEQTRNLAWRRDGACSRSEVLSELRAGRPLVLRIQWGSKPRGHFVILDGYRPPGIFLVRDPAGARRLELSWRRLKHRYDGLGWWTHTYTTQADADSTA